MNGCSLPRYGQYLVSYLSVQSREQSSNILFDMWCHLLTQSCNSVEGSLWEVWLCFCFVWMWGLWMCCLMHTATYVCIQEHTCVPRNAVSCPAELGSPSHSHFHSEGNKHTRDTIEFASWKYWFTFPSQLVKFTFLKSYWKSQQSVRSFASLCSSKGLFGKAQHQASAASLNPSVLNIKQEKITEVDSI